MFWKTMVTSTGHNSYDQVLVVQRQKVLTRTLHQQLQVKAL